MSKYASIDIGSNSVLLLVAQVVGKELNIHYEEAQITALGKGIESTGNLSSGAMESTLKVLVHYKKIIEKHSIENCNIVITATEASRVASNANDFYDRVEQEIGHRVRILSPEEEAYYTALGVSVGQGSILDTKSAVIMDIGGASTELIKIEKAPFKVIKSISLPIGAVRAGEWMEDSNFLKKFKQAIGEKDLSDYKTHSLVAVAGTMTSVAAMLREDLDFNPHLVQNFAYTPAQLETLFGELCWMSGDEIHMKYPYLGKRADTIVPGIRVALEFSRLIECMQLETSCYGLRTGTLFELSQK